MDTHGIHGIHMVIARWSSKIFKACRACRNSNQSTSSPCRDLSVCCSGFMGGNRRYHGHILSMWKMMISQRIWMDLGHVFHGIFTDKTRLNHHTFWICFFSYDSELAYHHNHHDPVASFGAAIWCDYSTSSCNFPSGWTVQPARLVACLLQMTIRKVKPK